MDEAVRRATDIARDVAPAVVLLSPAAASFDMFRDYEARGAAFKAAVAAIEAEAACRGGPAVTDTLRFPWDSDQDAQRREVAPSVFRPRRSHGSAGIGRSHASRPSPRPPERRAAAASLASSATVVAAPTSGARRGGGHASRAVARDRVPGRVVQGPQRERHEPDYLVLLAAVALSAIGILMVYSSTGVDAARDGSVFTAVTTQLTWAVVGAIVLVAAMRIDYRYWRAFSVLGFAVAVGLLVLVLLPPIPPLIQPIEANGATRWLRIGGLPAFHPAEFAKLALVVYLAHWLASRGSEVSSFRRGMLPFLVIVGVLAILVVLEPDLGTTGVIVLTGFTMFFVAGGSLWQLLLIDPPGRRRGGRHPAHQSLPDGTLDDLPRPLVGGQGRRIPDRPRALRPGARRRRRPGPGSEPPAIRAGPARR